MLVGEPGSGKTRMAEQLATYARLCNALPAPRPNCYEGEGAPAFWPWVQIIRSIRGRTGDPRTLASLMGPGAADIAQVVSEVKERCLICRRLRLWSPNRRGSGCSIA